MEQMWPFRLGNIIPALIDQARYTGRSRMRVGGEGHFANENAGGSFKAQSQNKLFKLGFCFVLLGQVPCFVV